MGQAVPEIHVPLSVGSKLELLLRAFVFAKIPCTSPYTHAFVRVCVYVYFILAKLLYNVHVHDRGAGGFAL